VTPRSVQSELKIRLHTAAAKYLSVLLLVEIHVFRLGLHQNANVRVSIFPERKEILIGGFRLALITR
jgi:hypothetical protein